MDLKKLLFKRKSELLLFCLGSITPIVSSLIINYIISICVKLVQKVTLERITFISMLMIIASVSWAFFYIISRILRVDYIRNTMINIRELAFEKIFSMSYTEFTSHSKQKYISNLVNDINLFEKDFFVSLSKIISNTGNFIVNMIILLFINHKVGFISIVGISFIFILNKAFEPKTIILKEAISLESEKFSFSMFNFFSGLETIKLNGAEAGYEKLMLDKISDLEEQKRKSVFFQAFQERFMKFMGFFITSAVAIILVDDAISGAELGATAYSFMVASTAISNIATVFPHINTYKASEKIYRKIVMRDEEIKQCELLKSASNKNRMRILSKRDKSSDNTPKQPNKNFEFNNEIEIVNLSFKYITSGDSLFEKSNLTIKKGCKYLLQSPSGSGKTTFLSILLKNIESSEYLKKNQSNNQVHHDGYRGEIYVDGVNLIDIDSDDLNRKVSVISQDVFLFEDTILNNITLYNSYSFEELWKAIEKSGLVDLIKKSTNGLNRVLTEDGKNLSSSERIRIGIARAIIKRADILIVDASISALDNQLCNLIYSAFFESDATVIANTNRYIKGISEKFDYIISIDNKKISIVQNGEVQND